MPEQYLTAYRESSRKQFLELLRARHWDDDDRRSFRDISDEILSASDVVEDLARCALPDYRAVRSDILGQLSVPPRSPSFLSPSHRGARDIESLVGADRLGRLDSEIDAWANRWNLRADWCVEVAYRSLDLWSQSAEALNRFEWKHRDIGFGAGHVEFSIPEWSRVDSLSEYRKSAKEKLQEQFSKYCDALKDEAAETAIPTGPTSRKPEEFRWTVLSQVMGRTFSEIAENALRDPSTIKRAVDSVLEHLGVERRQHVDGRPQGSTNRHTVRRQK